MLDRESIPSHLLDISADVILNFLTTRQHVSPHASLISVLEETVERFGCCPQAVDRAIEWLGLDRSQLIGRLRRTELLQLSRAIHRFWMQNIAATTATEPH